MKSKQTEKAEQFTFNWKKDSRVGSPQRVFRAVRDSVEDLGYDFVEVRGPDDEEDTEELRLKKSPISDTATFKEKVRGEKVLSKGRHKGYLITGIVLTVLGAVLILVAVANGEIAGVGGIVPLILGIIFLAISSRVSKAFLVATVEGEAYKAMAKMSEREQELDVVADVRLSVKGRIGIFRGGTEMGHETAPDLDQKIIEADFAEMCKKVEEVLPAGVTKAKTGS